MAEDNDVLDGTIASFEIKTGNELIQIIELEVYLITNIKNLSLGEVYDKGLEDSIHQLNKSFEVITTAQDALIKKIKGM